MKPPRSSLVRGIPNLRDLAGLRTADGRALARGLLYRSSHFAACTGDDAVALEALGLRTLVDLRGVAERAAAPSVLSADGLRHLHLPIEPSALAAMRDLRTADDAALEAVMHGIYRRFVQEHAHVFAALLRLLLSKESYPLVFHCTAGKDRTGFAAAVVLLALGVPQPAIVDDFLLSNELWVSEGTRQAPGGLDARQWTVLSRVQAAYLQTAFDAMVEGWGSTDAYLAGALGLDAAAREHLAALLLEA